MIYSAFLDLYMHAAFHLCLCIYTRESPPISTPGAIGTLRGIVAAIAFAFTFNFRMMQPTRKPYNKKEGATHTIRLVHISHASGGNHDGYL